MKRCQKRMFVEDAQGSEDGEHLERGRKNDRLGVHTRPIAVVTYLSLPTHLPVMEDFG